LRALFRQSQRERTSTVNLDAIGVILSEEPAAPSATRGGRGSAARFYGAWSISPDEKDARVFCMKLQTSRVAVRSLDHLPWFVERTYNNPVAARLCVGPDDGSSAGLLSHAL
jgi:hypothetical protein